MAELPSKHSRLSIREVEDSTLVESNHFFLMSEGKYIHIKKGRLNL